MTISHAFGVLAFFEVLSGLLIFNSRGESSGSPLTVFLGWDSRTRRHCLISRDSSHTHTGRANGRRASQPGPSKGKKPEDHPQETLNSPGFSLPSESVLSSPSPFSFQAFAGSPHCCFSKFKFILNQA